MRMEAGAHANPCKWIEHFVTFSSSNILSKTGYSGVGKGCVMFVNFMICSFIIHILVQIIFMLS